MEESPTLDALPENENEEEKGLSYADQLALAKALIKAYDERNAFIERQGGFDTFAESFGNLPEYRSMYDKLEDTGGAARKKFDENVQNKKEFVNKLRENGDHELAEQISKIFGIPKASLLKRIFKNHR